jgi:hypothetical protein
MLFGFELGLREAVMIDIFGDTERELICHMFFDGPIWDGNLISKTGRDNLVKSGAVDRSHGYNFLTMLGMELAHMMDFTKWKDGKHPNSGEMWNRYCELYGKEDA